MTASLLTFVVCSYSMLLAKLLGLVNRYVIVDIIFLFLFFLSSLVYFHTFDLLAALFFIFIVVVELSRSQLHAVLYQNSVQLSKVTNWCCAPFWKLVWCTSTT
jgi:hypothetical protein